MVVGLPRDRQKVILRGYWLREDRKQQGRKMPLVVEQKVGSLGKLVQSKSWAVEMQKKEPLEKRVLVKD